MYFNPRGYVSLDGSWVPNIASGNNFNPRGYVSLDSTYDNIGTILAVFQSTRLRKPRRGNFLYCVSIIKFQSTRLRKPRHREGYGSGETEEFQSTRLRKPRRLTHYVFLLVPYFNPRGYVSLDSIKVRPVQTVIISIHEAT